MDYKPNAAITGGLNTLHRLEVKAIGSQFTFLDNGTVVGSYQDSSFSSGEVGLLCSQSIECVFNNITIVRPT